MVTYDSVEEAEFVSWLEEELLHPTRWKRARFQKQNYGTESVSYFYTLVHPIAKIKIHRWLAGVEVYDGRKTFAVESEQARDALDKLEKDHKAHERQRLISRILERIFVGRTP